MTPQERYDICRECPSFHKFTKSCRECGCVMIFKVKLKRAECPLKKW